MKKILTVFVVFLGLVVFVGCDKKNDQVDQTTEVTTEETTETPVVTPEFSVNGVSGNGQSSNPYSVVVTVDEDVNLELTLNPTDVTVSLQLVKKSGDDFIALAATDTKGILATKVDKDTIKVEALVEGDHYLRIYVDDVEVFVKVIVEEADPIIVDVTEITVDHSEVALVVDESKQATYNVLPANATNQAVTWSTSDDTVATVDANGLITAVSSGTATIKVTSDATNTIYAEINVTVYASRNTFVVVDDAFVRDGVYADKNYGFGGNIYIRKDNVNFNHAALAKFNFLGMEGISKATVRLNVDSVQVSTSRTVKVSKVANDWDEDTVTWNTKPTILEEVGVISVLKADGAGYWIEIDVTSFIEAGDSEISLYFETTEAATGNNGFGFVSKEHAQKNQPSELVLVGNGTYTAPEITEISAKVEQTFLYEGETTQVQVYEMRPHLTDLSNVVWTSSDDTVATVNQSGLVTAVGGGTVQIRVSSKTDALVFTEVELDIISADEYAKETIDYSIGYWNSTVHTGLNVDANNSKGFLGTQLFTKEDLPIGSILVINSGSQYRLNFFDTPDSTTGTSRTENIETYIVVVDEAWWGTYNHVGINVSKLNVDDITDIQDEVKASFSIYSSLPRPAIENITSEVTELEMIAGESYQVEYTLAPVRADKNSLVWTSSNEAVATVDANGLIVGVGSGTTTIKFASKDDETIFAELTITVYGSKYTFTAVDDAFVRGGTNASKNYGFGNDFYLRLDPNASYVHSGLVKYNFEGFSGTIEKATLRLPVFSVQVSASRTIRVTKVANNWDEGTVTWATKPEVVEVIGEFDVLYSDGKGYWIEFDVSGFIGESETELSLLLEVVASAGGNSGVGFNTKESDLPTSELVLIGEATYTAPEVTEIGVNVKNSFLYEGQTTQIKVTDMKPHLMDLTNLVWSSSDETIATVDQSGLVTAIGDGKVMIRVASKTNPEIFTEVEIESISSIEYVESNLDYTVGYWNSNTDSELLTEVSNAKGFLGSLLLTREQLPIGTVIVINSGYQYRPNYFVNLGSTEGAMRTDNITTQVVIIDEAWWGTYNYVGFNLSKLGVSDLNSIQEEVKSAFSIYVPTPRPSIEEITVVSETEKTLIVGETYQVEYTVGPNRADKALVTWTSSNEAAATVDANGLITAVGYGTSTIKVTSNEDDTIFVELVITVYATQHTFTAVDDAFVRGGNYANTNYGYTNDFYLRLDPNAGYVHSGLVKYNFEGFLGTLDVATLRLSVFSVQTSASRTIRVTKVANNWDEGTVTWATKPEVVEVIGEFDVLNSDGKGYWIEFDVSGFINEGETELSLLLEVVASAGGNSGVGFNSKESDLPTSELVLTGDATYTKPSLTSITVNKTLVEMDTAVLTTEQLKIVDMRPHYVDLSNLVWSSSDETIATVDQTGLITAVGEGTVTIKVTDINNVEVFTEVTVTVVIPVETPIEE